MVTRGRCRVPRPPSRASLSCRSRAPTLSSSITRTSISGARPVGRQQPLAEPEVACRRRARSTRCARAIDQRGSPARLRARVAGRDQRDGLAAVGERQLRRRPGDVAQVDRLLDLDLAQARERDPVVASVDDRLQHRTEPRIGVGDPGERLIDPLVADLVARRARSGRPRTPGRAAPRLLELSCGRSSAAPRAAAPSTRPACRTAAASRRAGEHLGAQHLAAQRLLVRLPHRERAGIQLGGDLRAASTRGPTVP